MTGIAYNDTAYLQCITGYSYNEESTAENIESMTCEADATWLKVLRNCTSKKT